ncbi:YciI family protein [Gulosibacter faecalis]|uniref:YciI family protein n=1 Tax=Gulosibacter faecalis TaxID=272240 RepID=A0ABW5UWL5_9MICO|nr:YciI family protein [Gulosibacter faecalis]
MPYAIITVDKPNSVELRMELRPTHLEFLTANVDRLLAAGAKKDAEGNPTGSLLIVEADSLDDAQRFAAEDPYAVAGLFAETQVVEWNKAFFNFESFL